MPRSVVHEDSAVLDADDAGTLAVQAWWAADAALADAVPEKKKPVASPEFADESVRGLL